MEASKVTIQQLLRPTDTCIYVTSGTMMGAQENESCELAIVKHEGTQEHALFVFHADSMGQLQVDQLLPITGPFEVKMQYSVTTHCVVEICSSKGASIVFHLPSTGATAMLFSVVKHAKEGLAKSTSANSPFSFLWLQGYQACRTGWDRFSKPDKRSSGNHLIDFGDSGSSEEGSGLPEKWPWSHIFTPDPDGETASAKCESLVQEFDPLLQQPLNDPAPHHTDPVPIKQPPNKPHTLSSTLLTPAQLTPQQLLGNSIRPCSSETNLSFLRNEVQNRDPSMFHSQENLHNVITEDKRTHRQCFIADSEVYIHNAVPSQRPQASLDQPQSDNEEELDNPFQEEQEVVSSPRHDRHVSPPEEDGIELRKVKDGVLPSKPVAIATVALSSSPGASSLDYKTRRMRSSTAIPQSSSSTFYISTPAPLEIPSKLGDKLRQATVQTTLATSHSPKLARRKPRSETVSVMDPNKSSWVTRYQPGVLLLSGSMRECLIQRKLQENEDMFCEKKTLKLFCGTWNVNGQHPMQRMDNFLLSDKRTPDIYAIGFQELDLSTEALLKNESLREDQWISLAASSLELVTQKNFLKVSSVRLVGILLVVFAESSIAQHINDVETDTVATGILGHLGNKGGVAIRFNIHHSSLCIINSHLAAHMDEVEKRNQDYHQIYNKLLFFKNTSIPYTIMDHNAVVWMGDLNYRVQVAPDLTPDIIKARVDSFQFSSLLKHDQLLVQKQRGAAFTQFTESNIEFKPTYKYDPSTNSWDTSEKHRAPAWCDRVLYHCEEKMMLTCLDYRSHPEMIISDHKPVSALFDLTVKVVLPEKEREVLENITWKLDKQENETLPQVALNTIEFKYSDVKFNVPQIQQLVVTNTGQRPVRISFLPTPDKHDCICRPWLMIKPDNKVIMPGEKAPIKLTMFVGPEVAGDVMKDQNKLEDILVLHLEGGKDFFISISGNYILSSFGQSLERLVQLHVPIREVPTDKLVDISSSFTLSSSWAEYDAHAQPTRTSAPPLDIPKELFVLVDYLKKHGLDKENLFTDGGLTAEQEKIRDVVDAGGNDFPGSVHSVAAVLLMFLRALARPIIPHKLHQRCMDCSNNPTLCKQVLLQMPVVHRRSFVFIITFLKQLLDHSQENQMDAKILASIFGEVLLSMPHETRRTTNRKSATVMTKKKALFVYQFLVNNYTVNYS